MRELNIDDVEQVNGGGILEGLALFGTGISIAGLAGVATLGIGAAIVASPFVTLAAIGLSLSGGYQLVTPNQIQRGTTSVSGDFHDSDC